MSTPADFPMFIQTDGLYGSAWELLQFQYGDLTEQQWRNVEDLDDYARFLYIDAIVRGHDDEVARLEKEWELA